MWWWGWVEVRDGLEDWELERLEAEDAEDGVDEGVEDGVEDGVDEGVDDGVEDGVEDGEWGSGLRKESSSGSQSTSIVFQQYSQAVHSRAWRAMAAS